MKKYLQMIMEKKNNYHKIITKDKDGNEIVKTIPKKKNKSKYNI